jgi:hypothetical protein
MAERLYLFVYQFFCIHFEIHCSRHQLALMRDRMALKKEWIVEVYAHSRVRSQ